MIIQAVYLLVRCLLSCLTVLARHRVSKAAGDGEPGLPGFQLEVARVFFALPASQGFLLAGGAALLAQHLTARPTEDIDFFTAPERGHVCAARDALEAAARQRGWVRVCRQGLEPRTCGLRVRCSVALF